MADRWLIRLATGLRYGFGHIARCKNLAQSLQVGVCFVGDLESEWRADSSGCDSWESKSIGQLDSLVENSSFADCGVKGIIVDHYGLSEDLISSFSERVFTAVFRDDAFRGDEHVSIAIRPDVSKVKGSELTGPHLAPLARCYRSYNQSARARSKKNGLSVVQIGFGMRDSPNLTQLALRAVSEAMPHATIKVALGSQAPHVEEIRDLVSRMPSALLSEDLSSLADHYSVADLAIGAPGVSQYERACCGLPTILVPQNDVQELLAESWVTQGAAMVARPGHTDLVAAIRLIARSPIMQESISRRASALVDGKGAERLAFALTTMRQDYYAQLEAGV